MSGIGGINEGDRSGERVTLQRSRSLLGTTLIVFGQEVERIARKRAFQFVAIKVARKFVAVLYQIQRRVNGRADEVQLHDPALRWRLRFRVWCRSLLGLSGNENQGKHHNEHG